MKPLLLKHWSDISSSVGALYGFVNFFGLQYLGLSTEVSLGLSFVSGCALTFFLHQHFHDTVEQDIAQSIPHMLQTFEEK